MSRHFVKWPPISLCGRRHDRCDINLCRCSSGRSEFDKVKSLALQVSLLSKITLVVLVDSRSLILHCALAFMFHIRSSSDFKNVFVKNNLRRLISQVASVGEGGASRTRFLSCQKLCCTAVASLPSTVVIEWFDRSLMGG